MKTPFWIVQNNLNNADRVLPFIFDEHKISHTFIDITPFSGQVPDVIVPKNAAIICKGTTTMIVGAKKKPWNPGVWHNDNFKPSWYQDTYKEKFLNYQGIVSDLNNLEKSFISFKQEKLFIRSNTDYKELSGGVYTIEETLALIDERTSNKSYHGSSLEAFISPLIDMKEEYRLVVVNNQVVSGFSYQINGESTHRPAPTDIIQFGQSIANLGPAAVYCLDIGKTSKNTIGVVECNCFNGSNIYGEHESIILAVSNFVK